MTLCKVRCIHHCLMYPLIVITFKLYHTKNYLIDVQCCHFFQFILVKVIKLSCLYFTSNKKDPTDKMLLKKDGIGTPVPTTFSVRRPTNVMEKGVHQMQKIFVTSLDGNLTCHVMQRISTRVSGIVMRHNIWRSISTIIFIHKKARPFFKCENRHLHFVKRLSFLCNSHHERMIVEH